MAPSPGRERAVADPPGSLSTTFRTE
jgi:hypothetical protein